MPDYFVSVTVDDADITGHILAMDRDVAVNEFMRREGVSDSDVGDNWSSMRVSHIKMKRLHDYLGKPDPWGCGFEFDMIDKDAGFIAHERHDDVAPVTDPMWHAARIVYLTKNVHLLLTPIEVDNECHNNQIYPIPVLLDGWHRYFAHLYLGFETIRCTYGGLLDLLDYLEGKTDDFPEF